MTQDRNTDAETPEDIRRMLADLRRRMGDLKPVMAGIGEIILFSIQENFRREGRPNRWAELSEKTTIPQRRKAGRWPGKMLQRSGAYGLLGSVAYDAATDRVTVGANKPYAAVHHYGARKGEFGTTVARVGAHMRRLADGRRVDVSAHTRRMATPWGDIPARPYMMVQDADWDDIRGEINSYLTGAA